MAKSRDEYLNSYGRKNSKGKLYTLQQLNQQSLLQKLNAFFWQIVIIFIILLCFYCIYKIDIKKDSKDVLQITKRLTNLTLDQIYNDTLQTGLMIKTAIVEQIAVASDNLKQLDEQYNISNRIHGFLKGSAQTLNLGGQQQAIIEVRNKIQDFKQQIIKNNQTDHTIKNQTAPSQPQQQKQQTNQQL